MGSAFEPKDSGMTDSLGSLVYEIDGFPDPSICGETYAATGGAIYRRHFADTVWIPVYQATIEGHIQTVKAHNQYPGVVLAGGLEGFSGRVVLKSLDFGDTWEWLAPPEMVSDLDFAGDSAQTIFVVAGNVFRSLDSGYSWSEVFNASWIHITKVIYDPVSMTVYISGSEGLFSGNAILFYSRDMGNSWTRLPLGIADPIIDLDRDGAGWIYFATAASGIYRFDPVIVGTASTDPAVLTDKFSLAQNYPNPFNSETVITFFLPRTTLAEIVIYDVYGKEVATLLRENKSAGFHRLIWNGETFTGQMAASGIYICRLMAGQQSFTRKMFLIR